MITKQPPRVERRTYVAGDCVFREGEYAMCAYIVESGSVDVMKHAFGGPVRVKRLGKGELFGEMALIGESCRTATVNAAEDTTLLVVEPETLRRKLEAADPVIQRMVRILIVRLRDQTSAHAEDVGVARMGE